MAQVKDLNLGFNTDGFKINTINYFGLKTSNLQ